MKNLKMLVFALAVFGAAVFLETFKTLALSGAVRWNGAERLTT
jgi:hypothetical protein